MELEASESESDVGSDHSDNAMEETGQEIKVDLTGRAATDSDFHGIQRLLNQLFLKAHINMSELTDLIIGQNYIGTVVKQFSDGPNDDESDSDDDELGDVLSVTSVINLSSERSIEVITQLRTLLLDMSKAHGTEECFTTITNLLSNEKPLGLIINERFINLPVALSIPALESLSKDIKKACKKKQPFDFSHYIIISKLYKQEDSSKNKNKQPEILWSNPEDEIFDEGAELKFEFCVKNDSDSGLSGNWSEKDVSMTPYRRVLLISADKLDPLIEQIKEAAQQTQ